jgi:hypothetical protein
MITEPRRNIPRIQLSKRPTHHRSIERRLIRSGGWAIGLDRSDVVFGLLGHGAQILVL